MRPAQALGSDLVSILAGVQINGRPLSDEEILYNCTNVAVGGNKTTSHAASAGILASTMWPDVDRQFTAAPQLLGDQRDPAVEIDQQRVAARDAHIGGEAGMR